MLYSTFSQRRIVYIHYHIAIIMIITHIIALVNESLALAGQVSTMLVTFSSFWNNETMPGINLDGSLGR